MKKFFSYFLHFVLLFTCIGLMSTVLFLGLRELQNPAQRLANASVCVLNAEKTGAGSGTLFEHVALDRNGHNSKFLVMITAYHVVESVELNIDDPTNFTTSFKNPTVTKDGINYHRAHVIFADKEHDIAVCIISLDSHFSSRIEPTFKDTYLGQPLLHCGSPKGVSCVNTLMSGMISYKNRHTFMGMLDQTSIPIHGGCSGGGVFDKYGDYLGFVVIKADEGMSCMVKVSTIYWELDEVGMSWLLTGKNCPTVEDINALIAQQIKDRK